MYEVPPASKDLDCNSREFSIQTDLTVFTRQHWNAELIVIRVRALYTCTKHDDDLVVDLPETGSSMYSFTGVVHGGHLENRFWTSGSIYLSISR